MLDCIQIFTNTCKVTMQVKCAIGTAISHKLPIYNEYMCSCWVSTLFRILCCLFSNCKIKTLLHNSYPYITFYMCCKSATFLCARTPRNEMKRSIEISLLVVFSFNPYMNIILIWSFYYNWYLYNVFIV